MSQPNPLCKVCAKPVPKRMTHHSFGASEHQMKREHYEFWRCYREKPANREEAQRLVGNRRIVSVNTFIDSGPVSATTWDGESYLWNGHFHAQSCAAQFGQAMADNFPDYSMKAFKDAKAAREGTPVKEPA